MVDLSQAPVMGRFSGENPLDWVLQAEKYFNFYNISSEHKLSWASFYLDGDALEWYQWLFRNKQLAGWDHFVDKLFICFRRRNREAPSRRLAFLQQFTTMDYYQARVTALPSWSNMANLPLHQYCHARSNYSNPNIAHNVSGEMPDREIDNVVVTDTKLPAPDAMKPESCATNRSVLMKIDDAAVLVTHAEEEFCNSVSDDNKEDADFPWPQYFVESFNYDNNNNNNEVHNVFDESSDRSKDASQEPYAIQEPCTQFTMKIETAEEHFANDSIYLVAPTDAANDCAKVVVNEDKNDEAKIVTIREETLDFVTAIKEKAPLWIDYTFFVSSDLIMFDLIMFDDQHRLELAQYLAAMSCMNSACSSNQLLNRGIFNHLTDLGHADLVLPLHRYPPDQLGLDFPFDPGSSLLTMFLSVATNCVLCGASSNFERDKFVTFTVWNETNVFAHCTTLLGYTNILFQVPCHIPIIDFPFDLGTYMLKLRNTVDARKNLTTNNVRNIKQCASLLTSEIHFDTWPADILPLHHPSSALIFYDDTEEQRSRVHTNFFERDSGSLLNDLKHCLVVSCMTRPFYVVTNYFHKMVLKKSFSVDNALQIVGVISRVGFSSIEMQLEFKSEPAIRDSSSISVALAANFVFVARDYKRRTTTPVILLSHVVAAEMLLSAAAKSWYRFWVRDTRQGLANGIVQGIVQMAMGWMKLEPGVVTLFWLPTTCNPVCVYVYYETTRDDLLRACAGQNNLKFGSYEKDTIFDLYPYDPGGPGPHVLLSNTYGSI